jgi:hypothetical protein
VTISATSSSLDLSTKRASYHLVSAGADELIMVWDGQRHLANVANGDALMFSRDDASWRIAQGALRAPEEADEKGSP